MSDREPTSFKNSATDFMAVSTTGRITPPPVSLLDLQRQTLSPPNPLSYCLSNLDDILPAGPLLEEYRSPPSTPEQHRRFLLSILAAAEALVDESLQLLTAPEHEEQGRRESLNEHSVPAEGGSGASAGRPRQ